ncbi:hypothetical protein, partial [uncultured Porphyromonas sp.]|uniref:hypothetical protein n=1 Tax=uncultured Porphyromonas sp. TaxID=159274 RepID=UPI002622B89B
RDEIKLRKNEMKLRKNEIASPKNFSIPRWKIRICSEDFWGFLRGLAIGTRGTSAPSEARISNL